MATQWRRDSFGVRRVAAGETPQVRPVRSDEGRFLGRIAINVWERTARSDGLTYEVELADQAADLARSEALVAEVVERLSARLARTGRP